MSGTRRNAVDAYDESLAAPQAAAAPAAANASGNAVDAYDAFLLAHGAGDVAPPAPATPPAHPTSGATGDLLKDAGRIAGTAGANVAAGLLSTPNLLAQGVDWVGKQVGADVGAQRALESVPTPGQPGTPLFPPPERAKEMAFNTTGGTEYVPETWMGRRGMDALGGAILGPMAGLRAIPSMIGGSVTGGAAAEAVPEHPLVAALLGSLPGAYLGRKAGNMAIPPAQGPMRLTDANLAQAAGDHGIPISAADVSNNLFTKTLRSEGANLPFSGVQAYRDGQQTAINRAVTNTYGQASDLGQTPEVLRGARQRMGGVFDDVADRTSIPMGDGLMTNLQGVIDNARQTMPASAHPAIESQAMNIVNTAAQNGGDIGGKAYQMLTAKNGPISSMIDSPDPSISFAGSQFRTVLDDALQANAATADLTALKNARKEWRNFMTARELAKRADTIGGANPSVGDVSPAGLRQVVNKGYPNAIEAPIGEIPLNDLAKIGQRFLKEPGSSNTAIRSLAQSLLLRSAPSLASATAAGLAGSTMGLGPALLGMAAGAAGPLAVNPLVQRYLQSPAIVNRAIRASQNPNGFQFTGPGAPLRLLGPSALGQTSPSTSPTP